MTLVASCAAALLSLALSGPQAKTGDRRPAGEDSRWVLVDTELQRIAAFNGDRLVQVSRVSTGRPGHETPKGTFRVRYRYPAPVSSSYMVRMPYWICIDDPGQLGLHECQPQQYRQLGTRGSHGCIRLGPSTAGWLYRWLPDGAEVRIR
jgi:lipoprotein-anchoring transpeptidase ErfK/SrfK